jgi:MbtH protein
VTGALAALLSENTAFTQTKEMNMNSDEKEDTTVYKVVLNHEEQYSIWPADRENALGWNDAGKTGTKEECLAYIKEVWTDMRPLSLRKKMDEAAGKAQA